MSEPVTILVPARNEADTIARVVEGFLPLPWAGEVLVVDNGSEDATAERARAAGARVVPETKPGMGHAVRAGLGAARYPWVMKVDADLDRFDLSQFSKMVEARAPGIGLVKGRWQDPKDNMPMTRLLVMPAVAELAPGLAGLQAPNSGIYLVDRRCFAHAEIVGSYAADLDVMLRVYASGAGVAEVDIGRISHDMRDLSHYNAMAATIMRFFLSLAQTEITRDSVFLIDRTASLPWATLAHMAARLRRGARVQVFAEDPVGAEAEKLCEIFAPYPSFRLEPLEHIAAYAPVSPRHSVHIFALYPVAPRMTLTRRALSLQERLRDLCTVEPALLFMPPDTRDSLPYPFQPDCAADITSGEALADKFCARPVFNGGQPRALYQSFGSVPEPIRRHVTYDPPKNDIAHSSQ